MPSTIKLIQLLGSPFAQAETSMLIPYATTELYHCSRKNRILLLYLEKINKNEDGFSALYQEENIRSLKIEDAICRASQALIDADVHHSFFKTIRPYKHTTVDLDILIFGGENNYLKSLKAMQKVGNKPIVFGPRSTTLWDPKANIGIDLYEQVAVSFITYMDKQKLAPHAVTIDLANGRYVRALKPEADLACIIAHSIIKEQMYTLSEYYTFIHYLRQMSVKNFLEIVEENNLTSAARIHSAITKLLHMVAHRTVPEGLQQILDDLGEEDFETTKVIKNKFKTPHKYHLATLVRSLLEIAKGKETRRSMATQLFHILDPKFSRDFLKRLGQHVSRETY